MITLGQVPDGLQEIKECYGDPDPDGDFVMDRWWFENYVQSYKLPYPMRLSWKTEVVVRTMLAHKFVGPAMIDAFREILTMVGLEVLQKNEWDRFGGCFNPRPKTGSSEHSVHFWGIAVDVNPHLAPYGQRDHKQPKVIVDAFERRGMVWLPHDMMHCQACTGY